MRRRLRRRARKYKAYYNLLCKHACCARFLAVQPLAGYRQAALQLAEADAAEADEADEAEEAEEARLYAYAGNISMQRCLAIGTLARH